MKDPLSEEVIISVMKQLLELAPKEKNILIDTQSVLILDNWTIKLFGGCENKEQQAPEAIIY